MADDAPGWAKTEIAEAVKILKSDGVHIHRTYAAFQASLTEGKDKSETEETTETETEGTPPPTKDDKNEPPKRGSLWWGDRLS